MDAIRDAVAGDLRQPVSAAVAAAVAEIRARHGAAVAAVLFYGSCLRDGRDIDRLLDFYVFTDRYRDFHRRPLPALLNRVLPPNVYYLDMPFEGRRVRAKYAVISLPALRRQTGRRAFQATLWARLAQPCALPYARDAASAERVRAALVSAFVTMAGEAAPLLTERFSPRDLWVRAFRETYRTELRPERSNRPELLYATYPQRYDRLTRALVGEGALPGCALAPDGAIRSSAGPMRRWRAQVRWTGRRSMGRIVHVLRLAKAAFTFSDGLDYALWKIGTHSGVRIEPTPWQRRHPLMAAPILAWRLYRRGAFR